MAKAPSLRSYAIGWAYPHVDHPFGAERGLSRGEAVREINIALQAFLPLTGLINGRLARTKPVVDPAVGSAKSEIAIFEGAGLSLVPVEKGAPWELVSRYHLDPLTLLDTPRDKTSMGDLAVAIASQFVAEMKIHEGLGFISGFPVALFEETIEEFRARDYTVAWTTEAKAIDGTALKVRYRIEASPDETRITLVLLKGRTELHERPVRTLRAGLIDGMGLRTETTLDGDALLVRGMMPESLEAPVRIPLDELPPEVRAHL